MAHGPKGASAIYGPFGLKFHPIDWKINSYKAVLQKDSPFTILRHEQRVLLLLVLLKAGMEQ
jgi:hypothetical protein